MGVAKSTCMICTASLCTCMHMRELQRSELSIYYCTRHTWTAAARATYVQWHCSHSIQMSILLDYQYRYGKEQSILPLALLEAWWPANLASKTQGAHASHFAMDLHDHSCDYVCVHGPTILTNPECSELVTECIFHASRLGYRLYKVLLQ